jgi:hypothetical protein
MQRIKNAQYSTSPTSAINTYIPRILPITPPTNQNLAWCRTNLVPDRTLSDLIAHLEAYRTAPPPSLVCQEFVSLYHALKALHRIGLAHGNMVSGNIMLALLTLTSAPSIHLIDFGELVQLTEDLEHEDCIGLATRLGRLCDRHGLLRWAPAMEEQDAQAPSELYEFVEGVTPWNWEYIGGRAAKPVVGLDDMWVRFGGVVERVAGRRVDAGGTAWRVVFEELQVLVVSDEVIGGAILGGMGNRVPT